MAYEKSGCGTAIAVIAVIVTAVGVWVNYSGQPKTPPGRIERLQRPVLEDTLISDSPITQVTFQLANPTPTNPAFDLSFGAVAVAPGLEPPQLKSNNEHAPSLTSHGDMGGTKPSEVIVIPPALRAGSFLFWVRWKFKDADSKQYYQQKFYEFT